MINICSEQLVQSKEFYTKLFDFSIGYDSDWFVQLVSRDKQFELGVVDRNNELVPEDFRMSPNGFYVTFVVDNVEELYQRAKTEGFKVVEKPTDTFYGQRRLLLKDPSGTLVDVSSPIPQ